MQSVQLHLMTFAQRVALSMLLLRRSAAAHNADHTGGSSHDQ